ncbi:MAG: Na+/H+ antiporter NhaA [Vicinamibacterales bacterium]
MINNFLLLPIGAALALVWANVAAESYFRVALALRFAVNDIGMVFFVGLVTEEVIEAVRPGGTLHHWRRTLLPVAAAVGGTLGSVAVYLAFVHSYGEFRLLRGWPVAAAQDVAFAYLIARLIFPRRRGPVAFLLAVAIVSNALGILSIAIWFPEPGAYPIGLFLMAAAVLMAALLRFMGTNAIWPYLVTSGAVSWLACYWSGIQPALALVPIVPFLPHRPRALDASADRPDDQRLPQRRFEHIFKYPVQVVLFLFGLVNGGVLLTAGMTGAWAVLTAALVGRPVGILVASGLAVMAGLRLPAHLRWRELVVVSLAASAGFSFALFFATAVVPPGPHLSDLKLGALSTVAGALVAIAAGRLLHVGRFGRRPPQAATA